MMSLTDWQMLLLSALPITELRATIPWALAEGMPVARVLILTIIGNMLPVVPLILILGPLSKYLRQFPFLEVVFQKILLQTRRKGSDIQRYGTLGLMLFVAMPLPGTGAWTGAILTWLLGLPLFPSACAICLGVVIAGIIVTLTSIGVIRLTSFYRIEYLLFGGLALVIFCVWRRKRKKG